MKLQYGQRQGKMVISSGIAKYYSEYGMPLAALQKSAETRGQTISWLNVTDEFLKLGFSKKTILSAFSELSIFRAEICDITEIEAFVNSSYSEQRKMLYAFWGDDEGLLLIQRVKKGADRVYELCRGVFGV